jgi:hypothetical protein
VPHVDVRAFRIEIGTEQPVERLARALVAGVIGVVEHTESVARRESRVAACCRPRGVSGVRWSATP